MTRVALLLLLASLAFGQTNPWKRQGTVISPRRSGDSVSIRATLPADGIVTVAGTSLTLGTAHAGAIVRFTSADPVAVTVPADLPVGYSTTLLQAGAGLVAPVAAGGVTFTTSASTSGVGSSVFIQSVTANQYIMSQSGTIPGIATASLLAGLNGNAVAASWSDFATFMGGNLMLYSEEINRANPWFQTGVTVNSATQATIDNAVTATLYQENLTVVPGQAYVFSFDAMLGTLTGAVRYSVRDMTHSTDISTLVDYSGSLTTTAWTRISYTFTAPAGCTSVRVYPIRSSVNTGTIYFRRLQLSRGTWEKMYFRTGAAGLIW